MQDGRTNIVSLWSPVKRGTMGMSRQSLRMPASEGFRGTYGEIAPPMPWSVAGHGWRGWKGSFGWVSQARGE